MIDVMTQPVDIGSYRKFVPPEFFETLLSTSDKLKGLRVCQINATGSGGGVAEILRTLIPLMRSVGLVADWYVLPPDEEFFRITKTIHNLLQGKEGTLSDGELDYYLSHNERTALKLKEKVSQFDLMVVHDPQPLPLLSFLGRLPLSLWVCHLDTSFPNIDMEKNLVPFIELYDGVVFSHEDYVFEGLDSGMVSIVPPAIDPLSSKNMPMSLSMARGIVRGLGIDPRRPLVSQASRFDPWKDPWGVIEAYRIAKKEIPELQLALLGVLSASDDPEAAEVLRSVEQYAGDDPDIHLFSDPRVIRDREVNAFQRASQVIVQKSIREGFGLSVAEAMWKRKPVVGGNCGGIVRQIRDGKNGFLVNSPQECADRIIALMKDRKLALRIGRAAKKSVVESFLTPRLLMDYLVLFAQLVDTKGLAPVANRGKRGFELGGGELLATS